MEHGRTSDDHDGRRNFRLDTGRAQLRAHWPKAGGPGWPANEPARWQGCRPAERDTKRGTTGDLSYASEVGITK